MEFKRVARPSGRAGVVISGIDVDALVDALLGTLETKDAISIDIPPAYKEALIGRLKRALITKGVRLRTSGKETANSFLTLWVDKGKDRWG